MIKRRYWVPPLLVYALLGKSKIKAMWYIARGRSVAYRLRFHNGTMVFWKEQKAVVTETHWTADTVWVDGKAKAPTFDSAVRIES